MTQKGYWLVALGMQPNRSSHARQLCVILGYTRNNNIYLKSNVHKGTSSVDIYRFKIVIVLYFLICV